MNAWNSLKTFARTLALAWVCLAFVAGPGLPSLRAQFVNSQTPLPEYITHPRSRINPDTKATDISVHFSVFQVEPGVTDSPVVWWYCNGNFVAEQVSVIFNKAVNAAGAPTYEWWDPYVLPSGARKQDVAPPTTPITNRGRMTWESVYSVPAGSPSAVYRAFIPSLGSYTNYVEVLTTPATLPGGTRPSLQIVKSPVDVFRDEKSSVSIWGDAKYHGVGLFNFPFGATVDAEGFVYIADTDNHAIRRATPGGYLETVAGIDGEPWSLLGQDIILRTLTGGTCLSTTDTVVTFDSNRGIAVGDIIVPSGGAISSGPAWVAGASYQVQEVLSDKRSVRLLQDATHPLLGRVVTGFTAQHKPDARGPRTQFYFEREPLWGPSSNLELPGAVIQPGDNLVNVADPLSLTKGSSITGYGIPDGTKVSDFTFKTVTLSVPATSSVATTIFFGTGQSVPLTGSALSSTQKIVVSNTLSSGVPAAAQLSPNMYVLSTDPGGLGIANPTSIASVGTSTLVLSGTAYLGNSTVIAGTAISVATSVGSVALAGVKLVLGGSIATIASPTLPSGWSTGWFLEGTGIPNNTRISDKSKGGLLLSGTASANSKTLVTGGTLLQTASLTPPVASLAGSTFVATSNAIKVASTAGIVPGMYVESGTAFPQATRVVSTSGTGTIYVSAAAISSGANTTVTVYGAGPMITAELTQGSNVASVNMTDAIAALPTTTRVYGTGIPSGTTLNSTYTNVVMTGTATVTTAGTVITGYSPVVPALTGLTLFTGSLAGLPTYPATFSGLSQSSIASLSPGMRIYHPGVPNGTTLSKIQTEVLLDNPATATGVYNLAAIQQGPSKAAVLSAGVTQVRLSEGTSGLSTGMAVIGSGIPSGATVSSLPMSVLLSKAVLSTAVAGGTVLSSPSSGKWTQQVVPGISRNRYGGNQVTGNTNLLSYRYDTSSARSVIYLDNEQIRAAKNEPLFDSPEGVAAADDLSVYVADTGNNAIRRIYTDSNGHTVVLTLPTEYTKNQVLGKQTVVLNQPRGIFFFGSLSTPDPANPPALFVLDFKGLWRFALDESGSAFTDSTLIRNLNVGWQSGAQAPQPGDLAIFRNYAPRGMVVTDRGRTVYVADTVSHVIRRIALNDDYTYKNEDIVAGFVGYKASVDGNTGFYPLKTTDRYKAEDNVSRLSYPAGLAMDANQNLYFSEMGSHKVRRVVFNSTDPNMSAKVESLAGSGLPGPLDGTKGEGTGAGASFWYPAGLALDNTDPLNPSFILADSSNHSIRRLTVSGSSTVTTGTVTTGTSAAAPQITSVHMLGVTGCVGNRDFAEISEFNPEWKWYGEPIGAEWSFAGRAKLPTWYRLNLTDLKVEDSGPIELDIGNSFGAIGITAQSQLLVTPKSPDDLPKFWPPGYRQKITSSTTGLDATQLRIDSGDLDLTQSALIAPSDQVTYQWEVLNSQTLSGGTVAGGSFTADTKTDPLKLYVSNVGGIRIGDSIVEPGSWTAGKTTIQPGTRVVGITAGSLNAGTLTLSKQALTGQTGVLLENWIPLADSLTDTYQDTRVTGLLGNIGSNRYGNLTSISGAQKSTLTIRKFQKNLTGVVPQVRFRCQALSKTILAKQRDARDYVTPLERHDEVVTDDISWTYYPGIPSLPASFATSSGTSVVTTATSVLSTATLSFSGGVATISPSDTTSTQMDAAGNIPYLLLQSTDWINGLTGPSPGSRSISGEYLPLSLGKTVSNIAGSKIPLDPATLSGGGVSVTGTYQITGAFQATGSVVSSVGGIVDTGWGSLSITGGLISGKNANLQAVGSDIQATGGTYVTNGGTFVTTGGGFTAVGGAYVFKGGTVTAIGASLESFDQTVKILTGTLAVNGGTYTQVYQPVIGGTSQVLVGGTYVPYSQGAIYSGTLNLAAGGTTLLGGSYQYGYELGLTGGTVVTTGGDVGTWGGTLTVLGGTFLSKDGQISSAGGTLTAQGGGYSYTNSVFSAAPAQVNLYRGSLQLDAGTLVVNGTIATTASVVTNGTLAAVSSVGGAVSLGGTVTTSGGTVTVSGGTVTFSGGTPSQTILSGTVTATNGTLVISGGTLTYSDGKYTNRGGVLATSGPAIGFNGTGNWTNIAGGSLTIVGANFVTFGGAVNNAGTVTVSGGIVTSTGGTVISTGGTVSLGGPLFGGTVATTGTGPFNVVGGTLSSTTGLVTAAVGTGTDGPVLFTGGTVRLLAGTVSKTGGTVSATVQSGASNGGIAIVGGAISVTGGSLVGSAETLTTLGGTVSFGGNLFGGTVSTATGGTVLFSAGTVAVSQGQLLITAATQSFTSGSLWDTHSVTGGLKKTDGGDLGAIGGTLILTGGSYAISDSRVTVSGGDLSVAGGTVTMGGGMLAGYSGTVSVSGGDVSASGGQMLASVTVTGGSVTASGAPITILSGTAKITGGTLTTTGGTVSSTTTLAVEAARTSQGQSQAPRVVQTSFPPIFSSNAHPAPATDLTKQSFLFEELSDSSKPVTLLLSGSLWAFPKLAGDDVMNPTVRLWHQWMMKAEDGTLKKVSEVREGAVFSLTIPSFANYGQERLLAVQGRSTKAGFYFIRAWVGGSNAYEDPSGLDTKRIGGKEYFVDSERIYLGFAMPPDVRSLAIVSPQAVPPVQIVDLKDPYNQTTDLSVSFESKGFTSDQAVRQEWQYLPWDKAFAAGLIRADRETTDPEKQNTQTWSQYGRTIQAFNVGDVVAPVTFLGATLNFTATVNRGTLSMSNFPRLASGDPSGLYRLKVSLPATADGPGKGPAVEGFSPVIVLGVRDIPYVVKSDTDAYTISAGSSTFTNVIKEDFDLNALVAPQVTLKAKVAQSAPDAFRIKADTAAVRKFIWRHDRERIYGDNTYQLSDSALSIPALTNSELGLYTVAVTNAIATKEVDLSPITDAGASSIVGWKLSSSSPFNILGLATARTVANGTPSIVSEGVTASPVAGVPLDGKTLRVALGQTAVFEIPVTSSPSPIISWYIQKGSVWAPADRLKQTNSGPPRIQSVILSDAGWYMVEIASGSTVVRRTLKLFVEPLPDPSLPAASLKVFNFGSPLTLSAKRTSTGNLFSASADTKYFTFQWFKSGQPIAGETKETLTIASLSRAHSGQYSVAVSGVAGTRTSSALYVAVTANTMQSDALFPVTVVNTTNVTYLSNPIIALAEGGTLVKGKGSFAAGTKITLTGFASGTTLLGWNVFDASGNQTRIPARGGVFVMPAAAVTISPAMGRSPAGSYSGFLTVDQPWTDGNEWGVFPTETGKSIRASTNKVKGFVKFTVTSLGSVSGTVSLERKTLAFTSALAWSLSGEWSAPFQVRTVLQDGSAWILSGKLVLNSGSVFQAATGAGAENAQKVFITVDPSLSADRLSSLVGKSAAGPGVASGTTVIATDKLENSNTATLTLSAALETLSSNFKLLVGAEDAQADNVAHVILNGVILEKILPKSSNSQPLYAIAAANQAAFKALQGFISDDNQGATAPSGPITYTTAVHRFDPSVSSGLHTLGRGGVLSTSISAQGIATVIGVLPNGYPITYSGYIGRPFFRTSDVDFDAEGVVTFPVGSPTLAALGFGDVNDAVVPVSNIEAAGVEVMREAILRKTASICVPIWPTSLAGDSAAEPLFGALVISGSRVDGCLGVLSAKGGALQDSEYTHNYADGWIYSATQTALGGPAPFSATSDSRLLTISPEEIASGVPGTYPTAYISLTSSSDGNFLASGSLLTGLAMNPLLAGTSSVSGGTAFASVASTIPGLYSWSFYENTGRYVDGVFSTLSFADNLANDWCQKKTQLSVRIYGVILQGDRLPVNAEQTNRRSFGYAPGLAGFLTRGTVLSGNRLINVLGNLPQAPVTKPSVGGASTYKTYRIEAISLIPYEPY